MNKRSRLICGILGMLGGFHGVPGAVAQADGEVIKIIVQTNNGERIDVSEIVVINLMDRTKGGPVPFDRREKGVYEIWQAECGAHIRYDIKFQDYSYYRKPGGAIVCGQKEIAFNDVAYRFASVEYLSPSGAFANPEAWVNLLGASDHTVGLSKTLASAVASEDFGTVAIAGSEFANQLRAKGLNVEAEVFAKISYDATLQGVAQKAPNLLEDIWSKGPATATLVQPNNVVQMTPEARAVLEVYQKENFGWPEGDKRLGNTGWATMRDLAVDHKITAAEFGLHYDDLNGIAGRGIKPSILEETTSPGTT